MLKLADVVLVVTFATIGTAAFVTMGAEEREEATTVGDTVGEAGAHISPEAAEA